MTSIIVKSRAGQKKIAERQLAAAQGMLDSIAADEAKENPPAPPKAPPTCVMCGAESKSWGDRGQFGVQHTIGGIRALCHNQTQAMGEGCWQLYTRAKGNVLLMKGVKIGQHGRYNKPLADELLIEECARMMALPKHQADIAAQFEPTGGGSKKSGQALWNAKIETELKELRQWKRGGQTGNEIAQAADLAEATQTVAEREASRHDDVDIEFQDGTPDYTPDNESWADKVQREKDLRDERDAKKKSYVAEVPGSEGQ